MDQVSAVVAARSFSKTFSGRTVLRGVDLDVHPGEIHGLVGQNGSGKSTFIKILAGFHPPDPGASLRVRGEPVALPLQVDQPAKVGMSFVHQDLGLFERGTVMENLRVGRYRTAFGWRISWRRERDLTNAALARFGLEFDPDSEIASLSEVDRAMITIVRAVEQMQQGPGGGLLVLDEPTAYLPRDGVRRLFEAVRQVAAMGHGVLFVSHRLEEVKEITDRVTVLRDGAVVGTVDTASVEEHNLISMILGFSLSELYPTPHEATGEVVASVRGLAGQGVEDVSLTLRRGEIVGLTGLLGMGHERVPYLLFGAEPATAGWLELEGRTYDLREMTPRQAIRAGLALLPGNRQRDGGAPLATAAENMTLVTIGKYFSGWLRHAQEEQDVLRLMDGFQVRPPEPDRPFSTFSGGNQQKTLLAKWFAAAPKVLLMHEPTQGVDVGARKQIFRQIREQADAGACILIASVEYEDLAHMCDWVMVFRRGRPSSELYGDTLTYERIVEQSFRDVHALSAATKEGTKRSVLDADDR